MSSGSKQQQYHITCLVTNASGFQDVGVTGTPAVNLIFYYDQ